jgi:CheY-like chemotaxis protein
MSNEGATAQRAADDKPTRPLRVLVAEDDRINRRLLEGMLQRERCEIEFAENGQEAVDQFSRKQFDLIFMDCQMPVMDGLEATRQIRKRDCQVKSRTPIVALTAHAIEEAEESCLSAGMDDFVTKPIRPKEIQQILSRWGGAAFEEAARQMRSAAQRRINRQTDLVEESSPPGEWT